MPSTSRGYRYPVSTDTPDVPRDMQRLAADVDGDMDGLSDDIGGLHTRINQPGTGLAAKVATQASEITDLSDDITGGAGLLTQISQKVSAYDGAGTAITNLKCWHNSHVGNIAVAYGVPVVAVPVPAGTYRTIYAVNGSASGGLAKGAGLHIGEIRATDAVLWYVDYAGKLSSVANGTSVRVDYVVIYR